MAALDLPSVKLEAATAKLAVATAVKVRTKVQTNRLMVFLLAFAVRTNIFCPPASRKAEIPLEKCSESDKIVRLNPMANETSQVSALLEDLRNGDAAAASRLLPMVYKELRRLAAHYIREEKSGQTIQATELVHEAYLRLVGQEQIDWQGRSHFFAIAATSMRRILVDRARKKLAQKHGGGGAKVELNEALVPSPQKSNDIINLDEALKRLENVSPRQAQVVELRFFAGIEMIEIAKIQGVSLRTVKQDWSLARAWLHREISQGK